MNEFIMPKVCVVILNYNTYQLTIKEFANIEEKLDYENLEIVIVDNNSSNSSCDEIQKAINVSPKKYEYTLLSSVENGGYAKGTNIGIREAIKKESDYILIINNDILFEVPDTISQMVLFMENHPEVGAVSPRIVSLDGSHDKPIYYKKPSFGDLSFGISSFVRGVNKQDDELVYPIYAPRGSCMLIREDDIKRVGLLDEGTFLYYEEPIFAEKLSSIGKTVYHYGKVHVIHNHAETIKSNISRKRNRAIVVQSMDYYLKKYRKFNAFERMICRLVRKYAYLLSHK